jgi:hypothetical protein
MRSSIAFLIALVSVSLALSGCSILRGGGGKGDDERPTISAAELKIRQERIRAYFGAKRKKREILATTVTESGQILDWIRPESQVDGGKLAKPPEIRGEQTRPKDDAADEKAIDDARRDPPRFDVKREESRQSELMLQPKARGPKGTVPIVRFDVERYLDSVITPPENPEDVLRKMPAPAPASNDRYYAVWQRFGTFYGSAGRVNIWNTTGPVGNETSIAQVAVIGGSPMQAIEAGKIELNSLNGNRRPHFFVYYRTAGSASGDWVGGYNTLVDGWIQYSSVVSPGMSITNWESSENGNQYSLPIEVRIHQGNWWVAVAGQWAGYYPTCSGGDSPPCASGRLFSTNGIRNTASRMDWYGEVYDSTAPAATSTDMGSGDFAADWWQHAAYFRNLTYFWAPTTYWWWNSGSVRATDSACYSRTGPHYSNEAPWRNWFFYGGPGKEAAGCS